MAVTPSDSGVNEHSHDEFALVDGNSEVRISEESALMFHAVDKDIRYANGRGWSSKGHAAFADHASMWARPTEADGYGKAIIMQPDAISAETYTSKATPPVDPMLPMDYWDFTPFMATEGKHIATKSYVDNRMIVSETEPTSGVVGQQWFQPSTGNLHVFTGDA